jgi:hypothetical protein
MEEKHATGRRKRERGGGKEQKTFPPHPTTTQLVVGKLH